MEEDLNYNDAIYALKASITILLDNGWEKSDVITHLLKVEEYLKEQ